MLETDSGIPAAIIADRGYFTATSKHELAKLGFPESQQLVPTLVIPQWTVDGEISHYQHRPDIPRTIIDGKPVKYETCAQSVPRLDVPPSVLDQLGSKDVPLWITEGSKKADSAAARGLCCISLAGVWNWRGKNSQGGYTELADWERVHLKGRVVYIAFDSDVMIKPPVMEAMRRLAKLLKRRGAKSVRPVVIPARGKDKVGLDDFFVGSGTVAELMQAVDMALLDTGQPEIVVNGRQLRDVTADALDALVLANEPEPALWHRGMHLVRIERDPKGRYRISPHGPHSLRERLSTVATWIKRTKEGESGQWPPPGLAENILAGAEPIDGVPTLEGLSACPVLGPSGHFRREPGYDHDSKWFISSPGPWDAWDGSPTAAAEYLMAELLCDFPFVDDANRANAMGLMVLPLVRSIIDGPTPIHFADAPRSRSGKGLLLDACLMPALGDRAIATPLPDKEEERSKTLYALLLQGEQVILFDNVKGRVESQSFEACLTSTVYSSRILGQTSAPKVDVRSIWALTGNNVKLSVDLIGRSVWMRLDPKVENPENRTGFRHENLRSWIIEHRGRLVGALMAMVEAWVAEGRPSGKTIKASFDDYSRIVGGILSVCGITHFLQNEHVFKQTANDEDELWRGFYSVWWETYGEAAVTTRDLRALAVEKELLDPIIGRASTESAKTTVMGKALGSREGTVVEIVDALGGVVGGVAAVKSTLLHGLSRFKLNLIWSGKGDLGGEGGEGGVMLRARDRARTHAHTEAIAPPSPPTGSNLGGGDSLRGETIDLELDL